MNKNFLANIFKGLREIIEQAESPFAKLAIFILPILSPIVPACFTGLHIYMLAKTIFKVGEWTEAVCISLGILVGVVLELIGYVGAVALILSIFKWIRTRIIENIVSVGLNALAYGFYLLVMYLINYKLGQYFKTPDIVNTIVGLLSFITVPTGLLAADHLAKREDEEKEDKIRAENNDFKLRKTALKSGFNIFGGGNPQPQPQSGKYKDKPASHYRDKIRELLQEEYNRARKVLTPREVTDKINKPVVRLNHNNSKGYISGQIGLWCDENHIPRPKDVKNQNVPERSDP